MPISWDIGLSYPRDVYSHQDAFNVWDVKQNIKKPLLFPVISGQVGHKSVGVDGVLFILDALNVVWHV